MLIGLSVWWKADDRLFFKHQFTVGVTRRQGAAPLCNTGWHAIAPAVIQKVVVTLHLQTSAASYVHWSNMRSKRIDIKLS